VEKCGRAGNAIDDDRIRRLRFAHSLDTRVECLILVTFARQGWLRQRHSVLHLYVAIFACLFFFFYFRSPKLRKLKLRESGRVYTLIAFVS